MTLEDKTYHTAVLLNESVDALCIDANLTKKNGIYIDATLGGGGHTKLILSKLGENGKLIVFDQDNEAIKNAPQDKRVISVNNNFRFIENYINYISKSGEIEGIIADLGVSSHQFDTDYRGFSYRFDAKLDMRMNSSSNITAGEIIKNYSKEQLTKIFKEFGELDNGERVAKEIYNSKGKIETTKELCECLNKFYTAQTERKFLGKVFQALRIEVNSEMRALKDLLSGSQNILAKHGRIAIISYHSLEDRIVKNFFKEANDSGVMKIITKKPILPKEEEIRKNGRSRSAKLRIAEKL